MKSTLLTFFAAIAIAQSQENQARIYRGRTAPEHLSSIVSIKDVNRKHICGGSIIKNQWVLTAAHCVVNQTSLAVLAGSSDNSKLGESAQVIEVEKVVVHEFFSMSTVDYDMALLHLEQPLDFNENVDDIPLLKEDVMKEASREGGSSFIAGWGATEDAHSSKKLMLSKVNLLNPEECLRDIPTTCHLFNPLTQICSGPLGDLKTGAGFQDDGGPLIVNQMLAGVISQGEYYSSADEESCFTYTVYSSVSYYVEWIEEVTATEETTTAPAGTSTVAPEVTLVDDVEDVVYQVDLTLIPVDDSDSYSLSYRVEEFPPEDESQTWAGDDLDHYDIPQVIRPQENQQIQIQYGSPMLFSFQFYFNNNKVEKSPIQLRSAVKVKKV